jgi:hypothetical protein
LGLPWAWIGDDSFLGHGLEMIPPPGDDSFLGHGLEMIPPPKKLILNYKYI